MHETIPIDQLKRRAESIGLSASELARRAGVHHTTLGRILQDGGRDMKVSTMAKLSTALVTAEIDMRDYLLQLHPVAPERQEAAE